LLPSHAAKIRRSFPAARNNFLQRKHAAEAGPFRDDPHQLSFYARCPKTCSISLARPIRCQAANGAPRPRSNPPPCRCRRRRSPCLSRRAAAPREWGSTNPRTPANRRVMRIDLLGIRDHSPRRFHEHHWVGVDVSVNRDLFGFVRRKGCGRSGQGCGE
jgi:hypothetical protein